jgi:hypothetical protein
MAEKALIQNRRSAPASRQFAFALVMTGRRNGLMRSSRRSSRWFVQRTAGQSGRIRRIMIVTVARKLAALP